MENLIIFVGWGLCSWGCYKIAQAKHRNPELWGVLGLLFGVFAIIVISLLPNLI